MDLIYTNKSREDVGVLHDYTFDLAFGTDENDFELALDIGNHCCEPNCFVYIEGTEYGGIIDKMNIATKNEKLAYKGRTWHGILASKVIEPNNGETHLIVSGEANEVIGIVLERIGLTDLFEASKEYTGLIINNYSFDRYTNAYSGLMKMLASVSAKLKFTFKGDKVIISASPIVDYSQDEQFDNDQVELTIEKTGNSINHLICLGSGNLTERQIVHLYVDADGNISETQTFTGLQEFTSVYDYPNVESLDELIKNGKEKLRGYVSEDKVQMDFGAEDVIYDVGDIVGAKEIITGIAVTEKITKKIVTITQGLVNIHYKVGE